MRLANLFLRFYRTAALRAQFRTHLKVTSRAGTPFLVATSDSETIAVSADAASIHVVPLDDGNRFSVQLKELATGRVVPLFSVPAIDGFTLLKANSMLNSALDGKAFRPVRAFGSVAAVGILLFLGSAMYTGIKRLPTGPSIPATSAMSSVSPLAMAAFTQPAVAGQVMAIGPSIPASALEALKR